MMGHSPAELEPCPVRAPAVPPIGGRPGRPASPFGHGKSLPPSPTPLSTCTENPPSGSRGSPYRSQVAVSITPEEVRRCPPLDRTSGPRHNSNKPYLRHTSN